MYNWQIMKNNIEKAIKRIDESQKILILISPPDGDSVGTSVVLKRYLESRKKFVSLYSNKPINSIFEKLPILKDEIQVTDVTKIDFYNYDLLITIDTGNITQLYNDQKYKKFKFPDNLDILCIDHHSSNTNYAKYNIYEKISSTAEVLYKYLLRNKFEINKDEAELLYFAIAWDTGFFRWEINPDTLKYAGELLSYEIDYNKLSDIYFRNLPDNFSKIFKKFITRVKFNKRLKYTLLYIDKDFINKLKIERNDLKLYLDNFRLNFLLSLSDYDISIIIREIDDFHVISFRGNAYTNKIDLTQIKNYYDFKGGGHKNACSFASNGSYDDIVKNINIAIKDLSKKYNL